MFAPPTRSQSTARPFGRRAPFRPAEAVAAPATLAADARLFLMTFAGGLVFMTVYLA